MKKAFLLFRSFRFKVTIVMVALMTFAGALSSFVIYDYALKNQLEQLRDKLKVVAQAVALMVDADTILNIPLDKNGIDTYPYRNTELKLLKIKQLIPSIAYAYILKKTGKEGVFKFVIDVHPGENKGEPAPAYPGKGYDACRFPELVGAFGGPTADRQLAVDEWGVFLSGYAPIRDASGNAVAVLGIDMSAKDVRNLQREARSRAILVLILGIIVSLVFGTFVSNRVAAPIRELSEGTRYISAGNLEYRVKIKGSDEIAELGNSFNQMAKKLLAAKRSLLSYFYRVVQALICALEAKDTYTKGHSDRVAEYSEKVGKFMGLPKEKIMLLKEAALLHDIGKMGIREDVLTKSSSLTHQDRQEIEKHPNIGEEILKPVSLDKEMLAVVREHHERYDGKGYPDGLKGDRIDILAAIVSAADSYDAMTSHRPYRKNLTKDEALEQLKQNSGTQFNPAVVDAFLKAMREK